MTDLFALDQYLIATLGPLCAGAIYPDLAPQGTATPFVVYGLSGGQDVNSLGRTRAFAVDTLFVRCVGEGSSYAPLKPIADAIDAALQGTQTVVTLDTGEQVRLTFTRQAPLRYPEVVAGKRFNHLGGLYRVVSQPITTSD